MTLSVICPAPPPSKEVIPPSTNYILAKLCVRTRCSSDGKEDEGVLSDDSEIYPADVPLTETNLDDIRDLEELHKEIATESKVETPWEEPIPVKYAKHVKSKVGEDDDLLPKPIYSHSANNRSSSKVI
jgi:hypothetical protein